MKSIVGVIICAVLVSSCGSLLSSDKESYRTEVNLSSLADVNVKFDKANFKNIYIKLNNDLGTDIFLLESYCSGFVDGEINDTIPYPIPDADTYSCPTNQLYSDGTIDLKPCVLPIMDEFIFVSSGGDSYQHVFSDELTNSVTYYKITYYSCDDKKFYAKTLKITANQRVDPTSANAQSSRQ